MSVLINFPLLISSLALLPPCVGFGVLLLCLESWK